MYYNTNRESGDQLNRSRATNGTQNEEILHFLTNNPSGLSPTELKIVINNRWPITSIRRALSTLTKAGKLTKTDELRMGEYGKYEHVWRINND